MKYAILTVVMSVSCYAMDQDHKSDTAKNSKSTVVAPSRSRINHYARMAGADMLDSAKWHREKRMQHKEFIDALCEEIREQLEAAEQLKAAKKNQKIVRFQ